jgi:hypothetical protein
MVGDWKLELMAKVILESIWTKRKEAVIEAYKMIADCYVSEEKPKEKEMSELKNKLSKINYKIDNLIDMRAEGDISKEEYGIKRKELDKQKALIEAELSGMNDRKTETQDIENKLDCIKNALEEYIDFSKPKISENVIERLIKMIKPVNNNLFQWTLDFLYDYDRIVCGMAGRKNKPIIVDRFGNRLALYQDSTGSIEQ